MPELADIEGMRRTLSTQLPGRLITEIEVLDAAILRNCDSVHFVRATIGLRFSEPARRGKWLLLPTDGPSLLVHCGMTGRAYAVDTPPVARPDDRLVIQLDKGQLRYADRRKLRGIWLATDADAVDDIIGPLGPDALGMTYRELTNVMQYSSRRLKVLLMDQRVIAGLGNTMTDEILWQARLNPERQASSLTVAERRRLLQTMQRSLRTAVQQGHIPRASDWLTGVRDEPDPGCPRCTTPLIHGRSHGRRTIWCPHCQG